MTTQIPRYAAYMLSSSKNSNPLQNLTRLVSRSCLVSRSYYASRSCVCLHTLPGVSTPTARYVSSPQNKQFSYSSTCSLLVPGTSRSFLSSHGLSVRHASTKAKEQSSGDKGKELDLSRENPYSHLPIGEKVKDASYLVVIIIGVAVTGGLFYLIGRELFSSQTPTGVFGDALKLCKKHPKVVDSIGEPIKGYGELSSRGRRKHVSHIEYEEDGVKHMRMKFYIEGPMKKATVHVEKQMNDAGKYEYRYVVVELDGYPHRTIIVEDNTRTAVTPLPTI